MKSRLGGSWEVMATVMDQVSCLVCWEPVLVREREIDGRTTLDLSLDSTSDDLVRMVESRWDGNRT